MARHFVTVAPNSPGDSANRHADQPLTLPVCSLRLCASAREFAEPFRFARVRFEGAHIRIDVCDVPHIIQSESLFSIRQVRLLNSAANIKESPMNSLVQTIVQAVSVLSMAGGLVYAALQFRGWRTAQHVANVTKLIELQLQLRKMMVDDPSLAPTGLSIAGKLTKEETRAHFYNLMQLSLFEIAWFSHNHGQLTDDYFESWQVNMSEIVKRPAFRSMWMNDETKILHLGFKKYMDELIERTGKKAGTVMSPGEKLSGAPAVPRG